MTTTPPQSPLLSAQELHVTFPGRHTARVHVAPTAPEPTAPAEDARSTT
ncbi:hypothetical protein OG895_26455 [Streptomyces sp. NBC_00201]|nr:MULTISPECIES: hypothetical protein [unclassified Streptomyces]MCX5050809.1 hypothetical protein [Streptomyces sp. NBC_00474]MCX5050810.1 hypothetical protein [Streptomyces sp. NBC_00474]MCX5248716.1 hypothetical protein [Streptomyces sp. NBC_00201]MCX5248717.1 hypothetical protein [Streptomyces sp. NBC_00201]